MKRRLTIAALLGVVLLAAVALAAEWLWHCPAAVWGLRTTRVPHMAFSRTQPITQTTTSARLTGFARFARQAFCVTPTRSCATLIPQIPNIGSTHRSGKATSSPRTRGGREPAPSVVRRQLLRSKSSPQKEKLCQEGQLLVQRQYAPW